MSNLYNLTKIFCFSRLRLLSGFCVHDFYIYVVWIFWKLNTNDIPRARSTARQKALLVSVTFARHPHRRRVLRNAIPRLFSTERKNSPCKKKKRIKRKKQGGEIDLISFQWHRPWSTRNIIGASLSAASLLPPFPPSGVSLLLTSLFPLIAFLPLAVFFFSFFFATYKMRSARIENNAPQINWIKYLVYQYIICILNLYRILHARTYD